MNFAFGFLTCHQTLSIKKEKRLVNCDNNNKETDLFQG